MPILYNSETHGNTPTQNPGFYRINRLRIASMEGGSPGQWTDISFQMAQLDIFETIKDPLSGVITLIDTTNLIESVPIVGNEVIDIDIDDEAGKKISKTFRIYKISDRIEPTPGSLGYKVHFCSPEAWMDSFIRVSKAYDVKKYEDAVTDIFKTYLKSTAAILSEPTKSEHCFVIPMWSPMEACHWMASRSQSSTYTGGTYVFFETIKGFNFLSLDNLLDEAQNKPYATILPKSLRLVRGQALPYDTRNPSDTMAFEEWRVVNSFDTLQNSRSGMHANEVQVVNIMAKEPRIQRFTYQKGGTQQIARAGTTAAAAALSIGSSVANAVGATAVGQSLGTAAAAAGSLAAITTDNYDSQKHLKGMYGEAFPIVSGTFQPITEYNAHLRPIVRHQGLFTNEKDGGFREEEWVHKAISQQKQLENFVIEGVLPGSLGLRAGMQVKFNYPLVKNLSTTQVTDVDKYYSGAYIVTSVRRMFAKDKFYLIIQMAKDSVGLSRTTTTV